MKYLFDTNIVLAFVRQSKITKAVSDILNLTDDNQVFISVVTVGELWSIANQSQWSDLKHRQLQRILDDYIRVSISDDELIRRYADIDVFSQNKLLGRPLGTSARNMGKNDLWIAASASLAGASLITTDKDFGHLNQQFVEVIWINPDHDK